MESMADRLQRLRNEKRLTQKSLAEQIGIPVSTYRDWEYGREIRGEPYLALAEVFGVGLYELLTGEKRSPSRMRKIVEDIDKSVTELKRTVVSLNEY
jgi:transcriptional regulator with XRE-family HTH domain